MIPELENIANIKAKKIMSVMSEDMQISDFQVLAKHIVEEINKKEITGIIVTVGTDTLHFITAALSFFIKDLNKPVIVTASQRSIDRGSSDAFMNIICAVQAAAKFDGAVVVSCMHSSMNDDTCFLIRGTKVRKMHTSRRDAFRPINDLPLALVDPKKGLTIKKQELQKKKQWKSSFRFKIRHKSSYDFNSSRYRSRYY